jgi:hypothetical protein
LILFCSVFLLNGVVAWIFSSLSVLLSIALSVYFLAHHGDIFNKILKRLKLKR